ncbi:stemmadenine O-acetyltransferase-like [Euphorbia lathyris]|uniref:stemmadenine O-acetyltransferase-like n=1 Tax=Euphorbia lathyris TaxID=212925 RepID=UPI003313E9D2
MEIELKIISKELIKPSSPTPDHLRKLQFSFIDQNQYPVSIPFVFFYEKSHIPNHERCNRLKRSLSQALTIFYPLAGRINNYSYADCNDEGALFVETKANCQLSDILRNKNQYHNISKKFIPLQPDKGVHQYGSLFQITYFNCGGLVVSFAMPHMLGDGLSQFVFLNGWAAVARGNKKVEIPPFGSTSNFPPRNIPGFDLSQWVFKEKIVTKPFVFNAFTISSLKEKYSKDGEKLSRVQALCVFLFSRIMATLSPTAKKDNRYMAINSVNVRQILDPPIPNESFGNLVWAATALIDNLSEEDEIATRIKASIRNVNAESLKKLQKGELSFTKETFMDSLKGEIVRYSFTSLCNFPTYDVDFGWGKPEWVTTSGVIFDNLVICIDTKEGKGIEAWVNLTEEDMARFEKDKLLISHVSLAPNRNSNFNSRL